MTQTIYNERLLDKRVQKIIVPKGAEFVQVLEYLGAAYLIYRCDPKTPASPRLIIMLSSGESSEENVRYLGTVTLGYSGLRHVFEAVVSDKETVSESDLYTKYNKASARAAYLEESVKRVMEALKEEGDGAREYAIDLLNCALRYCEENR